VRKVWRQLKREGFDLARCTVSRLMRDMEIAPGNVEIGGAALLALSR